MPSAVYIADRHVFQVRANGYGLLPLEGPVTIAQQHAYRVAVAIGDDKVGYAVAR